MFILVRFFPTYLKKVLFLEQHISWIWNCRLLRASFAWSREKYNSQFRLDNRKREILKIRTEYEQADVLILDDDKIPNGIYKIENSILTAPMNNYL